MEHSFLCGRQNFVEEQLAKRLGRPKGVVEAEPAVLDPEEELYSVPAELQVRISSIINSQYCADHTILISVRMMPQLVQSSLNPCTNFVDCRRTECRSAGCLDN